MPRTRKQPEAATPTSTSTTTPAPSSAPTPTTAAAPPLIDASLSRAGSTRYNARPDAAGAAPDGELTPERALLHALEWIKKDVRLESDFVRYAPQRLIDDAEQMMAGVEDLPLLDAIGSPLSARDFVWVEVQRKALLKTMGDLKRVRGKRSNFYRQIPLADDQLRVERRRLARIVDTTNTLDSAKVCKVRGGKESPGRTVRDADEVVANLRAELLKFPSPRAAEERIDALERATNALRRLVDGLEKAWKEEQEVRARRQALKRSLYDTLAYISPWGIAAVGDDATKHERYHLTHTFKKKSKKKKKRDPAPSDPSG